MTATPSLSESLRTLGPNVIAETFQQCTLILASLIPTDFDE